MTRIKICGITRLEDALIAAEAGADALGFVFALSQRRVGVSAVREIVSRLPPFITTVGVFCNATHEQIESTIDRTGIDLVQLHGEEPPEDCARLSVPVLKRFGIRDDDTAESVQARVEDYPAAAVLLDPGAGDGKTFDWRLARLVRAPLILAGGLGPGNVRDAIRAARPFAVDASSGLEESPGRKSAAKIRAFVSAVREQDAAVDA